ncbi:protein Shroom1-like isoform X2 [Xenopus laevis]|uniref:Protein Shroom1-like isoform X2 n=1 Tax=Xenopus laevis TaxID=8355 RepID=A0A8J1MUH7_XENLA|nr:protein Shroom1-like isoform X2 [Xenopus laevis]
MSSFGSAIERWNIKSTGVVSGLGHSERILPVRSITLVDSAYSSFSGNLYIPEYQNSFQPDSCHFNDEQLSYMDVEYVRAIYNPSVVDQDGVYHDILSEHGCSEVALSGRTGSTFSCDNTSHVHRTSPAKLDNCVSNMSTDQVSMKCIYEDPLNMKDRHNHPNNSVFVPNHKAYGHQQNSPTEINILQEKENQMYNQSNYMEIKDNYFGRCFDVIRADGEIGTQDSCTQNSPYCSDEYRITQYAGTNRMSKEHFKGNDLQKTNEENTEGDGPYLTKDGQFVHGQYLSDVSFKNIRPSHKTSVSGKIGACAKKGNRWIMKPGKETHCSNSEGTIKDTEYDDHEQNIRKSRLGTRASQTLYYESNEDVSCPRLKAMNSMNDVLEVNNAPSFQKDATVKSIPLLSQQLQQEKPKSHPLSDLNCEKITKATTPMLYHLAGGRHSAFIAALNNTNAAKQEKLKLESKTFDKMNKISILQQTEPRPDNHKLPKNKSLTQLADLHDSVEGGNSGNLNSLAEECLMNDYIEKLKVAQKKVLRETSFKRKDLQMSLPCRFKLNPPKRPTIDHFRSYSSSSANEESRFLQTKSSVDSSYKKDDTEKVAVPRIGGRKRITKEQKKLCYSEPEKLDHLGIQKSNFAWKEEPTISNKREMSDSDITANRIKYLESKERTTSSSSLSKTELKQIQHNALVEYMERKTNQRPNSNPQVQMEKTPGLLNYNEWNIYSSETGSVDASQKYLRRRSAGASSSYDATVTWNDRFRKISPLGRSAAEQTAGLQFRTFSDQRTFDGSQETLEGSSPSLSQKTSTSTHHEQVLYVNIEFLPSTLSKSHIHNDRLTIPGDSTSAESGIICVSKSRGKSMEEIGTTDIVKLAELSHSSDQLYHIKRSVISSRLENTRTAAASHQDKLLASTQNETGNLTRQTHQESVLGPRRSDLANLEQEAHSWPLKASAVSSDRDNSCSSSPSAKVQPWASEPLQCLETEDEVFTRASIVRNEESSSSAFSYLHNTGKPVSEGEATALSFSFLPEQGHLEHLIVSESATSSEAGVHVLDDAAEKDMITQHPETSKVDKPLDLTADNREVEGDGELMQPECIDSSQQLELSSLPSSQVNIMQTAEPYLGHDINSGNEDTMEQKTEDLEQKSKNPEEEDDLPKVKLKSPEDERREELVKEIVAKDKSLMNCLQPVSVRESAINIMKSLFPMDFTAVEKSRTRGLLGKDNRETLRKNNSDLESISKFPSKITTLLQKSCVQRPDGESLDDITLKKMELLSNIGSKLEDLCEQREYLLSDICKNTTNGNNMQTIVKELCKPNEFERYMMFIGDLEKVVSLLFSLSARLTRVENALSKVDENTDAEEMQSLKERHNLLSSQREDAKDLKANLDRREQVVTGILVKYLNEEQLQDYKHFVRLKTSLLIEQKNLEEKIKLYEEQFESIQNSIPP